MGTIIFVILFVASNVLIGTSGFIIWYNNVLGMQQTPYALTMFVPFAKMFGYMLDFNCAIILIPVCRTFIRYLYDLSTQSQTATQKLLRTVLQVFPLDKALTFHKRVAYLILIFAVGHAFFHCLNYGFAVQNTMALFGIWPWASGTTIFVIMALMYGAAMPNVKHFQFELFWNTHHLFVLFFVLLVAHGRTGLNPNYWKWLIVPMTIYIAERIYRHRSAYRSVTLTSVNNMGKVLCITFERDGAFPDGYKEGQYLFLNCPHVSIGQWHPFTISSAPQEADVSVHMRVMGPSSWTGKVTEYLKLMIPPNASYAKFTNARSKGKVIGPDGQQIFCIYGPHSAPTQHIAEYTVDMIIGAGIGVTPVSATLRSIVHHRWKFSIGTTFPEHAYFCWIVSHSELDSFRWFIRVMKDADDAIHNALLKDTSMKSKTFEIHVYVTSTPRHFTYAVPAITDDIAFWGAHLSASPDAVEKKAAPWTESQMLLALKCPSDRPTRLGNVLVYNGRPQWDTRFEEVYSRHVGQNIGVAFCGNPRIGKDLKKVGRLACVSATLISAALTTQWQACESHSNTITNTYFKLHRENF
ncbi:hypothetical protein PBRA_003057 [Plasmodiophora brassicae]|uniref:FAD-binding FR-type domain-containing protein n=1 Tax=Plasmodiophora brassicae TaxID=37360 RepID=A0A0G4J701_PLABS|nr:hypothetical protein PBRA_003057 [Plasmodiophora brassicae]